MSYRLAEQEAKTICETLASLEAVADQMQARLNRWVSGISEIGACPEILSLLLSLSRNIDTLERVCSELSAMLNRPPDEPTPAQEEPA